jgi:hypothetical protein
MATLGRREKCLRNRSEKEDLRVTSPPDAKPTPPGAAGDTVDQNPTKALQRGHPPITGVGIGELKR